MKTDRKLLLAVVLLIGLVLWLLVLTINRGADVESLKISIKSLQEQKLTMPSAPTVINGRTPQVGVDYFVQNGSNGKDAVAPPANDGDDGASAYDIAVAGGFIGTVQEWLDSLKVKGDKGDPAPELDIDCQNGRIVKKYSVDVFWQATKIKCEVSDE